MTDSQAIKAMRAEAVETADAVLAERVLLDPDLADRIEKARQRVLAAAAEPVTVAFVGQFTTGKSVLLGALLGDPGLLPATANATTGNITALHPVVDPGDGPTRVQDPVAVRYFDGPALAACRDAMLRTLAADARKYGLAEPGGDDWEQISDWCRRVAWDVEDLRVPVRELIGLRDAAVSYPWLVTGAPLRLDWATVREGLLPIVARPPGHVPGWELPPARPVQVDQVDAEFLRSTASLVDRVSVTVRVPARYWPFERHRVDDDVVLLDFPGRGASPSEMRDRFLLRHTLPRLNTIMLLIDPERPDASDPGRIRMDFAQLDHEDGQQGGPAKRRDAVLALISRFDRLEESAPELATDRAPLSSADIVGHPHLTGLKALWREAERATSEDGDGTAIVSVATAWALGDADRPPPIRPPAHRDPGEWRATLRQAAAAWGQIAGRVPGGQGIAGPLRDYAQDGGLGRLRRLVTRHAEQHGLAQKRSRIHPHLAELRELAGAARQQLEEELDRRAESAASPMYAFRDLVTAAKAAAATSARRCAVDVFAPSFTLASGRTGAAEIQRAVTAAVFGWREWERLFSSVTDRTVRPGQRPVATLTRDFLQPFTDAVTLARQTGADVADRMILHWLVQRRDELGDGIDRLRDGLGEHREAALARHPDVLEDLRRAVQIKWLSDLEVPPGTSPPPTAADIFPLRADRALPWHRERADRIESHQVYVMRLRRELAASAVRAGHTAMAARLRRRTAVMHRELNELTDRLPIGQELDAFLTDVFGPAGHRTTTEDDRLRDDPQLGEDKGFA
ncbi:hypothetical protein GCM10010168_62310 [Actinoplanes ianthinogenes]|uniref:Dynamin family protein n=1 Tax=Actinoplanes ianthinogenes TaxID=122358 RepID=A0ABM7LJT1_9ACTN|nr:hypothetical protein [Actinoplanes ianthinogenes]BCJ39521.1 hypothetical protein Aiant_01780 [Actinoplanes ianthinogenes]GGR35533.1 hypothetical protein GCM10010168_62310 [Actinoplanes ianthinogenes]